MARLNVSPQQISRIADWKLERNQKFVITLLISKTPKRSLQELSSERDEKKLSVYSFVECRPINFIVYY